MALPWTADVVVVGAGIMGLTTGLFLARARHDVVVLERGEPWREASGVNAGSLAVQNKLLPLVPFTLASLQLWRDAAKLLGAEVGFVPSAGLHVATSAEETTRLAESASARRAAGLESVWLEGAALADRFPWLGRTVTAATFARADSFTTPLMVGPALIGAFTREGGRLHPRISAQRIVADAAGARVETSEGSITCRSVVIAAGAWSGELARSLGVSLPVGLDVNMLSITEPAAPVMSGIVTHVRGNLTLKQYPNGTCMIGGGWQGRGSLDDGRKDIDHDALLGNLRLAARVVPGLGGLRIVRSWAGFEGVTPDLLPLFGRLPGHPRVYITACCRGGFTQGLIFGRLMAELVTTGKTSMPVGPFDPARFVG